MSTVIQKPQTVKDAIAYIQNRYPDANINEANIREALGLDEDAPDPPGLTEAIEQLHQDTEQEDGEEAAPTLQIIKTAPIVRLHESLNRTITPQKQITKSPANIDKLQKPIVWSSKQQGENAEGSHYSQELIEYVDSFDDLKSQIKNVIGKTGIGKTTMRELMAILLNEKNKKTVCFTIHEDDPRKVSLEVISEDLSEKEIEYLVKKLLCYVKKEERIKDYNSPSSFRTYLNKVEPRNLKQAFSTVEDTAKILDLICKKIDFWLIEFKDYDLRDINQFNKDIDTIAEFWRNLNQTSYGLNIVLFIQQEMYENSKHFFLKKDRAPFIIHPWKPEELTSLYINNSSEGYPFAEDALNKIASQCGGNPRLFKVLIHQCLNKYKRLANLDAKISVENVTHWIDPSLLVDNKEEQYTDVFCSPKLQQKAVQVTAYLEQHNLGAFQYEITQLFFGTDTDAAKDCSKFLIKLEEHNYITSETRRGKKFVKLNP